MNMFLKKYLLGFILIGSLFSCHNPKTRDISKLDEYEIKPIATLECQKIGQISTVFNFDGTVRNVAFCPSWEYEQLPLMFFKEDCLFTKEEIVSFKKEYAKSEGTVDEKYSVMGTNLYSFEKTKKLPLVSFVFNYDTSTLRGKYALYYLASLREYEVTHKGSKKAFSVYLVDDSYSIGFLPAED